MKSPFLKIFKRYVDFAPRNGTWGVRVMVGLDSLEGLFNLCESMILRLFPVIVVVE